MAVIWVGDKCAVCGGQIKDAEKVILISVVKATTNSCDGSSYTQSNYPEQIRVNFIPYSNSQRSLRHLSCSVNIQTEEGKDEI